MKSTDAPFDLNALHLIVALDDTRNVTRAAESLDMSQSGFSTALAKLRVRFANPLFVRTAKGMEATPLGARMVQTAREILARVQSGILEQDGFDPLTDRTQFTLSMPDLAELVFLPNLLKKLHGLAPHVSLQSQSHRKEELPTEMEAGRVDIALGYFPELGSNAFYQQRLYSHTYVSIVRHGHPALKQPITKDVYSKLGHAVVMSPARTNDLLERFLEQKRVARTIRVRTPHHLSLPAIVAQTDLIATIPLATGAYFAELGVVELVPLPFRPPLFSVQQHWHTRNHHDQRHGWLRQQIHDLFNDCSDPWLRTERRLYGDIRPRNGALRNLVP